MDKVKLLFLPSTMHQCGFIICNKYTTLVGEVDNGTSFACGAGVIREISILSPHILCDA